MTTIEITGTVPLIMHNVQTADPMNHFAKEIAKLTSKRRNKTEADQAEIARLKFISGLYYDTKVGPYIPAPNLFRCLIESGAMTREGKKIERGISFLSDRATLEYDGPRDLTSLWDDGNSKYVDTRIVVVSRQRIPQTRPIFPEWSATFEVLVDDQVLDPDGFAEIVIRAGRAVGIGDFRRFYGRFTAILKES